MKKLLRKYGGKSFKVFAALMITSQYLLPLGGMTSEVFAIDQPTQFGWNIQNGNGVGETPGETPVEVACVAPGDATSVAWVNEMPVSFVWDTVAGTNVKYQRQNTNALGEEFIVQESTSLTNSGFGNFGAGEGTYSTQVRSWEDTNDNNLIDGSEEVSEWSPYCYIGYDVTAPNLTATRIYVNDSPSTLAKPGDTIRLEAEYIDNLNGIERIRVRARDSADTANHRFFEVDMNRLSANTFAYEFTVPTTYLNGDPVNESIDANFFRFSAYDEVGNWSGWSTREYFTIDATAPAQPEMLAIYKGHNEVTRIEVLDCNDTPTTGYTNDTRIAITWEASIESDVVGYWFGTKTNPHHQYFTQPSTVKLGNMNPGNNPYFYTVSAVDAAGNESTSDLCGNLILDQDAPIVEITSHEDGDYVSGIVTVSASVSDSNLWRYYFVITNSANNVISGPGTVYNDGPVVNPSITWDTTGLPDGEYHLHIAARDKADNRVEGISSETVTVFVVHNPVTPQQTGYNVNNGDPASTPRDPNEFACTGGRTNINGVSVHWTDTASSSNPKEKYERQYSMNGTTWVGSEIYSDPYTNYRNFGGNPGTEGTFYSRVRTFVDFNDNNRFDAGEAYSDWSNTCSITFDRTAPAVPTGL